MSEEMVYNLVTLYSLVGAVASESILQIESHHPEVDELRATLFKQQLSATDRPQPKEGPVRGWGRGNLVNRAVAALGVCAL